MSDDLYLKAYWAANEAGCAHGSDAAAAILRERFIPRVTGPHDGLIERLETFGAWAEVADRHRLTKEAAAAIASLQAELDEARAALWQVAYKNWKDPEYAKAIARAALGDKQ